MLDPTAGTLTWEPDPALVAAKNEGRVRLAGGVVSILTEPVPSSGPYPPKAALVTGWTGLIQEPPAAGRDATGQVYRDDNYLLLCGPGAAAVTLYYWPASRSAVTRTSGRFIEPVNLGSTRHVATTWSAAAGDGNARGMIMYLAEVERPSPDRGASWWSEPGLMNWSARPPSTDIWTLADAINWEASGRHTIHFFYVIVSASDLTQAALLEHIHSDINAGVPVVIAARTSNGSVSLPDWRVTSTTSAVNHFVTVVGYDDAKGTYSVMDTCGKGCNSRGVRGGVGAIGRSALFDLIQAESDNDGVIW